MKVLVIGNGAREHAITWKLAQSHWQPRLYCAPGNAGTSLLAQNIPLAAHDVAGLLAFARAEAIDLTVVGPEAPLVAGLADRFREAGLAVFGPSMAAATLEGSKVWSKRLMQRWGIPTASAEVFDSMASAAAHLETIAYPAVIKADGLAAGKGVTIVSDRAEALQAVEDMMERRVFGSAGERVIVEECLYGREVSLLAFTDGETVVPMVAACDYKRVNDGDQGPNTGGMGSYSPPSFFSSALQREVTQSILEATVKAMAAEGCPYQGVLYAGLMLTDQGPKVLEFNARFGDPETQVVLPRLKSDLLDIMLATVSGRLGSEPVAWDDSACCGVVLASGGYPGHYETGKLIDGLEEVPPEVEVFHAGTMRRDGRVVTNGGRVLTVVAKGKDMREAREKVYAGLAPIRFEGMHYRRDIALREVV